MSDGPGRVGSRLLDACVVALLASMALYGVVQIISVIWLPLCISIFVIAAITLIVWLIWRNVRRW